MRGNAHGAACSGDGAGAGVVPCSLKRKRGNGGGDGAGWQATDAGSAKGSRRLSARQVQVLEKNFAEGVPVLEAAMKTRLALELGIEPRQVTVWFQNRRARFKSKQLEVDMAALKASFATLAQEHRELSEEVQLLRAIVSARIAPCQDVASPISITSADSNRCSHAGGSGAGGDHVPSNSLPMRPRNRTAAGGGCGGMFSSAVSCGTGVQAGDARFVAVPATPAPALASGSDKSGCSSSSIFDGTPIARGCPLPALKAIADAGAAAVGIQHQAAIELPRLCDVWKVYEDHPVWPCFELDGALFLS